MTPTSVSLLERLRAEPSDGDWERLHTLYAPLIRRWLAADPGLRGEADDLAQEVMVVVLREVGRFERRRDGSFRKWLRFVAVNRVREHRRAAARRPHPADAATDGFLAQLADPASDLSAAWDRDHDKHVFDRLLDAVRPDFAPATWAAFRRFALEGATAAAVAAELGVSENAVLLAKSRVLRRLREEAGGLID